MLIMETLSHHGWDGVSGTMARVCKPRTQEEISVCCEKLKKSSVYIQTDFQHVVIVPEVDELCVSAAVLRILRGRRFIALKLLIPKQTIVNCGVKLVKFSSHSSRYCLGVWAAASAIDRNSR